MRRNALATDGAGVASSSATRTLLLFAALIYTAFVIYGSLVPLDFRPMPWNEAIARYQQIAFLKLGIGSRADWVANLLLFIPLTFLWTGGISHQRSQAAKALASLFVLACAVMLSAAIEFTQLYFPPRTVSLNDLFAETLGGTIGIVAWWLAGPRFARWLGGWKKVQSHLEITQRLTLLYLFLLFGYSLLPLDLTISPVEVYHKFREGKLNLIPFASLPANPVHALYEVVSDSLLWFVPALMWRWSAKASAAKIWIGMTGVALLLETLQLFVYSRVSDVTDIFTAMAGVALGVWVAGFAKDKQPASHDSRSGMVPVLVPLSLSTICAAMIVVVFWYPFEFRTDGAFLRERLHDFLGSVPFQAYYFGTEYRAITEVMHKVLFFIPLGATLAWFVSRLRWSWRGYGTLFSFALIAGVALLVVAGRLTQPEKRPDIMDPLLQWMGGAFGFAVSRILFARARPKVEPTVRPRSRAAGHG